MKACPMAELIYVDTDYYGYIFKATCNCRVCPESKDEKEGYICIVPGNENTLHMKIIRG